MRRATFLTTIRARLLALNLLVAVPLVLLSAWHVTGMWREALKDGHLEARHIAVHVAADLSALLREREMAMAAVAAWPLVRAMDPKSCAPIFRSLSQFHPELTAVSLRDREGRLVCSTLPFAPQRLPPDLMAIFAAGIESGQFEVSGALYAEMVGLWVSALSYPIRDDQEQVVGLLIAPIDLAAFGQQLAQYTPPGAIASVIDRKHQILLRSEDMEAWVGKPLPPTFQELYDGEPEGDFRGDDIAGHRQIGSFVSIPLANWVVALGLPEAALLDPVRRAIARTTVVGLLILAAIFALTRLIDRQIVRSTDNLAALASAIGAGRTDARAKISGPPELASVARHMNAMLDAIQAHKSERADLAERLAATLENISDAFVTLDRDWRVTYANGKAASLIGRARGEVLGVSFWQIFPDDRDSDLGTALARALASGSTVRQSGRAATLGRWFDFTAHPTTEGLAVYFRDVTAERAREAQLHLLETAVARQNDLLIVMEAGDGEGLPRIAYTNEAFTRLTGWTREEAMGQSPLFFLDEAGAHPGLRELRQAWAARRQTLVELICRTKAGERRTIEMDAAPLFADGALPSHWVAVARDVTERKRLEESTATSAERFRLVADATNSVIWDNDLVAGRIWYSDNIARLFGYDVEQDRALLQDWQGLIHPEDRPGVAEWAEAALRGVAATLSRSFRLRRKDGSYAEVRVHARILRDAAGRATRAIGAWSDESEYRALDRQLRQSQRLEVVGQLTGGVAHDFNNLLTVILGNSELLVEGVRDQPELKDLAGMVERAALRGAELTRSLLAFSRRQQLAPQTVLAGTLISGMETLLRRTLPANVSLLVSAAPELWPIDVDPSQFESALLNLCLNARDAMPAGGQLTIVADNHVTLPAQLAADPEAQPGEHVAIRVVDNGAGMSSEVLARVFEPFFTTKEPGKGTGLGLSMVYGFVRQSSGFIEMLSEPGKGTSISLYFPRAVAAAETRQRGETAERNDGGSEHLLVVEDDEMVRNSVVAQLTSLGYRVSTAGTASEAIAFLQTSPAVDLVLSDIVMPGSMNGRELARHVAATWPAIRIVLTSGYSRDAAPEAADGGPHFLAKPYRRSELARKIRQVLADT